MIRKKSLVEPVLSEQNKYGSFFIESEVMLSCVEVDYPYAFDLINKLSVEEMAAFVKALRCAASIVALANSGIGSLNDIASDLTAIYELTKPHPEGES